MRTLETIIGEFIALKRFLEEENFDLHEVTPDGNCLFAALVDQLIIHGIFCFNAEGLREAAVKYLKEHPFSVRKSSLN